MCDIKVMWRTPIMNFTALACRKSLCIDDGSSFTSNLWLLSRKKIVRFDIVYCIIIICGWFANRNCIHHLLRCTVHLLRWSSLVFVHYSIDAFSLFLWDKTILNERKFSHTPSHFSLQIRAFEFSSTSWNVSRFHQWTISFCLFRHLSTLINWIMLRGLNIRH